MARDTRGLLDHIGWKGEKEVHVVGISMGAFFILFFIFLLDAITAHEGQEREQEGGKGVSVPQRRGRCTDSLLELVNSLAQVG